jgi:hypothetical protein
MFSDNRFNDLQRREKETTTLIIQIDIIYSESLNFDDEHFIKKVKG